MNALALKEIFYSTSCGQLYINHSGCNGSSGGEEGIVFSTLIQLENLQYFVNKLGLDVIFNGYAKTVWNNAPLLSLPCTWILSSYLVQEDGEPLYPKATLIIKSSRKLLEASVLTAVVAHLYLGLYTTALPFLTLVLLEKCLSEKIVAPIRVLLSILSAGYALGSAPTVLSKIINLIGIAEEIPKSWQQSLINQTERMLAPGFAEPSLNELDRVAALEVNRENLRSFLFQRIVVNYSKVERIFPFKLLHTLKQEDCEPKKKACLEFLQKMIERATADASWGKASCLDGEIIDLDNVEMRRGAELTKSYFYGIHDEKKPQCLREYLLWKLIGSINRLNAHQNFIEILSNYAPSENEERVLKEYLCELYPSWDTRINNCSNKQALAAVICSLSSPGSIFN